MFSFKHQACSCLRAFVFSVGYCVRLEYSSRFFISLASSFPLDLCAFTFSVRHLLTREDWIPLHHPEFPFTLILLFLPYTECHMTYLLTYLLCYLHPLEYNLHENRDFGLFRCWIPVICTIQYLACSRCSVSIFQMHRGTWFQHRFKFFMALMFMKYFNLWV